MTARYWTTEELTFVETHPDWTARQIAEALNRSLVSVYQRRDRFRRGLTASVNPWTDEEERFILNTPHFTAAQVAKHLDRTEGAVLGRREILRRTKGMSFLVNSKPNHVGARKLLAKTCPACGLLLEPRWFYWIRQGAGHWSSECIRCNESRQVPHRSRSAGGSEKLQALTLPHAYRNRMPWLESDIPTLEDPDLTLVEKALRLARTYRSITSKCDVEGYTSRKGLGDPKKGQWIIDNPNADRMAE